MEDASPILTQTVFAHMVFSRAVSTVIATVQERCLVHLTDM
jgi:hypothetical protein